MDAGFQRITSVEPVGRELRGGVVAIGNFDGVHRGHLAVLERAVEGNDTDWDDYSKDLPAEAFTEAFIIEFRFESDDVDNLAGWYIDDLVLSVPGP